MDRNTISSKSEDYLEAIAELTEANGKASTKDIANRLHVSDSTVIAAMQRLSAKELIDSKPGSAVTLTASGAERAAVIRHRHVAMKVFFKDVLKLDIDEADETACKIEHVIGEKVMARFVFLAEAIQNRGDCAELRAFLDSKMPRLCPEDEAELIPLSDLAEGQSAIVVKVSENLRGKKKFADLGLVRGSLLKMEGHAPFGNLLRIKVLYSSLSMRSQDASFIFVKLAPSE